MSEFTESFHKLTTSIITQLIAILQVKYDQAQSPLTTHPTTMLVALSSFVVYYVLHVLLLRSPRPGRFACVTQRFLVCSGYAAVATLAAAVFPEGASPFLYAIFGLLSASEVLYMSGLKLVTKDENEDVEDEVEIKDDDMVEIKVEVYKSRVSLCFELVCFGFGKLAKFFHKEAPPMPI